MSFPRYPNYKDSGVKWLGEVPGHWDISQSRRMFAVRSEPALASDRMLTASQKYGVLFQSDFVQMEGRRVVEVIMGTESLKHVEPNDFIISMRSFQGGIEWCKLRGSTSFHYVMLRPVKGVYPPFFAHLFKSVTFIQALRTTTDLIRDGQELRYSNFVQVDLPFVPLKEQTQIAAFLDSETSKIDSLVAEQLRLMELLKEKRQAVISHAVTRGLNPDAPMKPSGIEWLGDVPEHWSTPSLYMRYSSKLGKMLDSSKITGDHLIPYTRNVDVQWGSINLEDLPYMDIREDEYERYTVKTGDLLVCEGGAVGRAAIVPIIDGVLGYQKALHRLRAVDENEIAQFMYFTLLWAAQTGIFDQSGSSTIAHLTGEQLRKYRFPKPPVEEQTAIAAYLESESAKLDTLTAEAQRAIALLQERRTALISAAVTGQIDVRGAVAST
jgi:type I restriction enzyme, S subunit